MACSEDGKEIRMMPYKAFYKKLNELNTPEKQYKALVTSKYYELASGSAMCISKKLMEANKGFDEKYKYWEDGPFFANSNLKGYKLETAFDIVGIYYRLGGISNSKKKSKLQIGLDDDAKRFYRESLNNDVYSFSLFEKRRIMYSIKKLNSTHFENIVSMIMYFDVVIDNQITKLVNAMANKKSYEKE